MVDAAICSNCGHRDTVECKVINMAPTDEIVRAVCQRDPCPACGAKGMVPEEAEAIAA